MLTEAKVFEHYLSTSTFNVEEAVENSYHNFHAKGVDYICLKRSPELTVKLYIFNGDVSKFPEVVHPHDHRYDFRTRVLCGALRNSMYSHHTQGTVFNEFEWRTPLNGGSGFSWLGETKLRLSAMETYFRGEAYRMNYIGIHTIKVLENQTVILQEQFADQVDIDDYTSTFTLNKEPPSLSGLYEKFNESEILILLGRVHQLLNK